MARITPRHWRETFPLAGDLGYLPLPPRIIAYRGFRFKGGGGVLPKFQLPPGHRAEVAFFVASIFLLRAVRHGGQALRDVRAAIGVCPHDIQSL